MKALVLTLAVLALITAGYIKASPSPSTGYTHLYFCADSQGHVLYVENDRQIDCPGAQEILRVVGNEVKQP
jgi:hypothetical protein